MVHPAWADVWPDPETEPVARTQEEKVAFRKEWDERAVEPPDVLQRMGLNRPAPPKR